MGCTSSNITPDLEANSPIEKKEVDIMRGDLTLKYEARKSRELKIKEKQQKMMTAAEEMAGKIMEEKEMLSLGTRSRNTSCVTSRAGSPTTNNRKQVHFRSDELKDANGDSEVSEQGLSNTNGLKNDNFKNKTNSQKDTDNPVSKPENGLKSTPKALKSNGLKIESTELNTKNDQLSSGPLANPGQTHDEVGSAVERLSTIDERANSRASGKLDSELTKRG